MREADVIIAAMGSAGFVKPEDVKEGAVLVDVGVSRVFDEEAGRYRVKGDVDKAATRRFRHIHRTRVVSAYDPCHVVGECGRDGRASAVIALYTRCEMISGVSRVVTRLFCAWSHVNLRLACVTLHAHN